MEIPRWSFEALGLYLFNQSNPPKEIKRLVPEINSLEESDLCILDILYSGCIEQIHQIFI